MFFVYRKQRDSLLSGEYGAGVIMSCIMLLKSFLENRYCRKVKAKSDAFEKKSLLRNDSFFLD